MRPIGSCGPFHDVLPCDGIQAGPAGCATKECWVRDNVEAFRIGEISVDCPHGVKDDPDLCNVIT